jgi:hypothetical protein
VAEIHVLNGRLFAADGSLGFVVREDQLALLDAADAVAFAMSGSVTASGETAAPARHGDA